jgi:hypothetical protein
MYNFLLGGSEIDHPYLVEHPEALASIFVEYTGGRRDLVFGDVVWLSHYRFVDCIKAYLFPESHFEQTKHSASARDQITSALLKTIS